MPVRRFGRPSPVVTIDRSVLTNETLSPTARLVYALLLACLDTDTGPDEVAHLAGLSSVDELAPFLNELEAVGAADVKDHVGAGQVITVHESPLLPEQRTHACVPCQDCGGCSCEYIKGLCRPCSHIRDIRNQARADIARWQQEVEQGKTYAIGSGGARLHRWDCSSLNTVERSVDSLESAIKAAKAGADPGYVYWPRLPKLYTAEELRLKGSKKRNCGLCGPDPL
ncbi:hypothetical protein [Streptomyces lateritius]|uniref:hypothetical protein n=1 Tax=Streptomyces lateritius TaxID=67313 RepID=UPI001672A544|nr:hypothetical protein [Streptomyces lateritius]GGU11404.1 hypothetical protein GCM10010272_65790 [Streptomyces lateritius]